MHVIKLQVFFINIHFTDNFNFRIIAHCNVQPRLKFGFFAIFSCSSSKFFRICRPYLFLVPNNANPVHLTSG